jgi:hypothetical protein
MYLLSLIASSAGCFSGPDFCLIFAPCEHDDPEIHRDVSKSLIADTKATMLGDRLLALFNIGSIEGGADEAVVYQFNDLVPLGEISAVRTGCGSPDRWGTLSPLRLDLGLRLEARVA